MDFKEQTFFFTALVVIGLLMLVDGLSRLFRKPEDRINHGEAKQ